MQKNVCILGSINMDLVLRVNRLVKPGETILSKNFKKVSGGKGANQAVAAKRLGANVSFIGMVGADDNGFEIVKAFKEDKIDVSHIKVSNNDPTGMAIITVDDDGRNSIVVVPGANMKIDNTSIEESKDVIKDSKLLIAQFETSIEATIKAFKIAKENGVITILNPAPARNIPEELLKLTDIIAPNETEVFELTDIKVDDTDKIREAADKLIEKGAKFVIITLGERGAALADKEKITIVPAYKVKAVDTTAAGDSFIGALATKLQNKKEVCFENIEEAIKFANKVSSIVVQKQGAQPSLPYLDEVLKAYKEE
ncbi:ribokinase [Clostridium magnum]|uniref:Ribokinase n=1 Tax=Clostridium magnum DSM 2767 TaxID=1121326 RepID=A0A162TUL1_9CLOT|nr:ribokinase [Clostridium magnum]KZL93083.1 ribokinase [Clostridium magnum DSM 2767]SHI73457.1 ribokinase [Clostridium magnum DSM 2767]